MDPNKLATAEDDVFDPFGLKDKVAKKMEAQKEPGEETPPKKEDEQQEPDHKAFYEKYRWLDDAAVEELKPLIEAQEGDNKVKAFVEKSKTVLTEWEQIQQKETEREQWFRQNKITSSQYFQENYQRPVAKALDLYNGLLGETGEDNKPRNEEMWAKLRETIFNKGNEVTVSQVKKMMSDYEAAYTKRFGQAPQLPTVKEVLDAREELIAKELKKIQAIQKWEEEQQELAESSKSQQLKKVAERRETSLREKDEIYKKATLGFDYKSVSEFFKEDAVKGKLSEVHERVTKIIKGEAPDLEYGEYLELYAKARLFDELLPKATEAKKFIDEYKQGNPGFIPSGGGQHEERDQTPAPGKISEFSKFLAG